MKKILFIQISNSSFIANDIKILNAAYNTQVLNFKLKKGFSLIPSYIVYSLQIFFNLRKFNLIYIWFADYHSFTPVFLSKIFKKKVIIVAGGFDVDEILKNKNTLGLKNKIRRSTVNYSFRNSTKVLAVSKFIEEILKENNIYRNVETVYNGINIADFVTTQEIYKKNIIITIAGGGDFIKEAKRKRHDFFIEIGNTFNISCKNYDASFLLIGYDKNTQTYNYLKNFISSSGIKLIGKLSRKQLLEYLIPCSIYMQLSYHEAFGIAQAEAMLNRCIPISNPGGAIPEVVGDAGILIPDFDVDKYVQAIKDVFDGKYEHLRPKARQRIISHFSLEQRKEKLLKIIDELLN